MFPGLTTRHTPPRLVLVVAHPDDETFGCGSLLLHAAEQGWDTTVVCATRGEAGEPAPGCELGGRSLADAREQELNEAAALLGVDRLVLLDFTDSGMDGEPPVGSLSAASTEQVADALRPIVADVDPDLLLGLDAADGHRDHAQVRDASIAVGAERGVPVYLHALPRSLMSRWAQEMATTRPDMAHLQYADLGTPDDEIAVVIDTSDHLSVREKAIAVHASQTSPFEGLSDELRRAFLTREHLVRASTPSGPHIAIRTL